LRAPVAMLAEPRVGMLVKMGAVEIAQSVRVVGKVRGHPVKDDAEAMPVQSVYEIGEIIGCAEPRGRGEIAHRLIAPATVEGMLGDREELDVGEVRMGQMADELVGQDAVAEKLAAITFLPGAQVYFVDRDRLVETLPSGSPGEPFLVVPFEIRHVPDH